MTKDNASARYTASANDTASARHGLTLVELLVVLVILASLATIALESIEPRVQQSRFEATRQTLQNIEAAIIRSDTNQSNGSLLVSGYVADTGVLPESVDDLLIQGTQPASAVQSAAAHPEIQLIVGWRGPYIHLPAGSTSLVDGWGNPFISTPTVVANGDDFVEVRSLGSDEVAGQSNAADPYTADQVVTASMTSVNGQVVDENGAPVAAATVKLYLPNPTGSQLREVSDADNDNSNATFTFSDVPPGTRVIHVTADALTAIVYLIVPRGGLSNVVITVR